MSNKRYMLDTCAINHIIEDEDESKVDLVLKLNLECYVTYIQKDELDTMKEKQLVDKYLKALKFLNKIKISEKPTSVAVLGVWRLGKSRLGYGDIYKKVLEYMRKKQKKDHVKDAIIADSAYSYEMTLITDDKLLFEACGEFNIDVLTLDELMNNNSEIT
jgi:predicted nucleic acid-binding protein